MSRGSGALYGYGVSLTLIAVVASPALQEPGYDSFPASSYPMFARDRDRKATVHHVVGLTEDGRHRPIPPPLVANDEVLQAAATIAGAIRTRRAQQLCEDVAVRVAAEEPWREFTWIEVTSDRYDVITYFEGSTKPLLRDVHARCRIRR